MRLVFSLITEHGKPSAYLVFAPRTSREAIDAELEYKLQPLMRKGGVVFGLDHRIPNGTPIDLYRYYVKRAREILGLEPDPEPGWARMAF